ANTPAAIASPFGVSSSSATTTTGTRRIRRTVSGFGRLSGNTSQVWPPSPGAGEPPCTLEHGIEHLLGQLASEGVLLTRVKAAEQRPLPPPGVERGLRAVCESRTGARRLPSEPGQGQEGPGPGERAERHDHRCQAKQTQLPDQVRQAVVALLGRRGGLRRR